MKKHKKREQRLQTAKLWLAKYEGKNTVKGYRKHFGVDLHVEYRQNSWC